MPFLQIQNQIESSYDRAFATLAPVILILCAIITGAAEATIAVIDALQAAVIDARILLSKPAPIRYAAAAVASPVAVLTVKPAPLTKLQCRALCRDLGIARTEGGKERPIAELRKAIALAQK